MFCINANIDAMAVLKLQRLQDSCMRNRCIDKKSLFQ